MSGLHPDSHALVSSSHRATQEDLHLLDLGVRQDFTRKLNLASSFGLCFSCMSTTTGIVGEKKGTSCSAPCKASQRQPKQVPMSLLDGCRDPVFGLQLWRTGLYHVWVAAGVLFHNLHWTGNVGDSVRSSLRGRVGFSHTCMRG